MTTTLFCFLLKHCLKKKKVKREVYIKKEKVDCSRIKEMLNEFADSFMVNLNQFSIDEMWDTFEPSICSIMETCIPQRRPARVIIFPGLIAH